MASADLNATLLAWPQGHEVAEHVNEELDVLLVVLGGGRPPGPSTASTTRSRRAPRCSSRVGRGAASRRATSGLRYLSVHCRRGPLQIQPLSGR